MTHVFFNFLIKKSKSEDDSLLGNIRKYFAALADRKVLIMANLNFHCEITASTSMNIENKLVPFFFVSVCSFSTVNIFFLRISKS